MGAHAGHNQGCILPVAFWRQILEIVAVLCHQRSLLTNIGLCPQSSATLHLAWRSWCDGHVLCPEARLMLLACSFAAFSINPNLIHSQVGSAIGLSLTVSLT